jgi:hypothetical protein
MSGGTMARTGLRMMPTFPSSPLKFRTAGFPQYGFKAGFSGRAFPRTIARFASVLRAARSAIPARSVAGYAGSKQPCHAREFSRYPRGPRSGSGCSVPIRHHLSTPSAPLAGHPDFAVLRLIRDAFTQRVVPGFR